MRSSSSRCDSRSSDATECSNSSSDGAADCPRADGDSNGGAGPQSRAPSEDLNTTTEQCHPFRLHQSSDNDQDINRQEPQQQQDNCHQQNQQQDQQQEQQQQSNKDDQDADGRPKRNPYCSRCRNHGKSAQVKGHKRHCEYRDCQCEGCKLVECRQIVSAAQIKRRRYQKQDEESGRKIEVSPPVLIREPNDPATLIAKTLIGSGNKHTNNPPAAHKQVLNPTRPHLATSQQAGINPTSAAGLAASSSSTHTLPTAARVVMGGVSRAPPIQTGHPLPHLNLHQHQHPLATPATAGGIPNGRLAANPSLFERDNHLLHQQQNHHHQQHQQPHLAGHPPTHHPHHPLHGPAHFVCPSHPVGLNDAYRFFHFPSSVLSAAAAASLGSYAAAVNHPGTAAAAAAAATQLAAQQSHTNSNLAAAAAAAGQQSAGSRPPNGVPTSTTAPTSGPTNSTPTTPTFVTAANRIPSMSDQLTLVKEIHQTFGPLAIFAWLRAEQFNLQKIRTLIELARSSFEELIPPQD